MADANARTSPLETVAETVGERATEAFTVLGNETRLAILLALWEAMDPGVPLTEGHDELSFSELRERVGVTDSGQFNYHLDKLVGPFVEHTDDGYALTTAAEQVLQAVLAGTLADPEPFEGEPVGVACYRCGGETVVDYDDRILTLRCTECEGAFSGPDTAHGALAKSYRPAVGLLNRTPQQFFRHGNVWDRHRLHSALEGACAACSGHVTSTIHACDAHETAGGTVCERCGSIFEYQLLMICDVCKSAWRTPAWGAIFADAEVMAWYRVRGLDHSELYDTFALGEIHRSIARVAMDEEERELTVTATVQGDTLHVKLDAEGQVIAVAREEG